MSLDFSDAIDDIKARLFTIPNIDVIDTHDNAVILNGVVKPYIVMSFGGPVRSAKDRGITESRRDASIVWVMLECVSNNLTVARDLKFEALRLLVDFVPTNAGRLTIDGGSSYTLAKTTAVPFRFVENVRLSFTHNLEWDETP